MACSSIGGTVDLKSPWKVLELAHQSWSDFGFCFLGLFGGLWAEKSFDHPEEVDWGHQRRGGGR